MTQNGHQHEMLKKFVSWGWTLGVKMSQAYASFSCSNLTTHCTPGGCITVICFDEAWPFNKVRNILVLSAGSFMGIRFSISRKAITHLIHSSGHPSLKIPNCWEYLEPQAWLSRSMRNSNLIHSNLAASGPSTLSNFFTRETKGIGGGGVSSTEGGKAAKDLENLLMAIVWIEILQQKCDHSALYWEDNRNLWFILDYF
jgi:hypothetical protein